MWTSLRMRVDLVNVSLELLPIQLFDHQEELVDRDRLPSLAKIDFIKSKFEFESFSDWSKTIDLVSQEVIFEDTRHKGTVLFHFISGFISQLCLNKAANFEKILNSSCGPIFVRKFPFALVALTLIVSYIDYVFEIINTRAPKTVSTLTLHRFSEQKL